MDISAVVRVQLPHAHLCLRNLDACLHAFAVHVLVTHTDTEMPCAVCTSVIHIFMQLNYLCISLGGYKYACVYIGICVKRVSGTEAAVAFVHCYYMRGYVCVCAFPL